MKRKLSLSFLPVLFIFAGTFGQPLHLPRTASPAASVSQTIGISNVVVNYSRPSVKSRVIWGELVPYGWNAQGFGLGNPAPWRAGANENTTITFAHDAIIEGKAVPAGTYGLFYVINKDNTGEVILSKDHVSWGSFFYDPKLDQLRVPITVKDHPFTEMLTYEFTNLDKNTAVLGLNWEKKHFPLKISFDVDKIVMNNIKAELRGPAGFSPAGFATAAGYSLTEKTDLQQGLTWIDAAIATSPTFTNKSTKAGFLREMGKQSEADKLMKEAVQDASNAELNTYGYLLLQQNKMDDAIEVFLLNTKRHPDDPNVWDSLGEGYYIKGDKKNAAKYFKKSLAMNPTEGTRLNSEKYLKLMGEMK